MSKILNGFTDRVKSLTGLENRIRNYFFIMNECDALGSFHVKDGLHEWVDGVFVGVKIIFKS